MQSGKTLFLLLAIAFACANARPRLNLGSLLGSQLGCGCGPLVDTGCGCNRGILDVPYLSSCGCGLESCGCGLESCGCGLSYDVPYLGGYYGAVEPCRCGAAIDVPFLGPSPCGCGLDLPYGIPSYPNCGCYEPCGSSGCGLGYPVIDVPTCGFPPVVDVSYLPPITSCGCGYPSIEVPYSPCGFPLNAPCGCSQQSCGCGRQSCGYASCGCGVPTLPPLPPVVGCGCPNYLRQVTCQPPFL